MKDNLTIEDVFMTGDFEITKTTEKLRFKCGILQQLYITKSRKDGEDFVFKEWKNVTKVDHDASDYGD